MLRVIDVCQHTSCITVVLVLMSIIIYYCFQYSYPSLLFIVFWFLHYSCVVVAPFWYFLLYFLLCIWNCCIWAESLSETNFQPPWGSSVCVQSTFLRLHFVVYCWYWCVFLGCTSEPGNVGGVPNLVSFSFLGQWGY